MQILSFFSRNSIGEVGFLPKEFVRKTIFPKMIVHFKVFIIIIRWDRMHHPATYITLEGAKKKCNFFFLKKEKLFWFSDKILKMDCVFCDRINEFYEASYSSYITSNNCDCLLMFPVVTPPPLVGSPTQGAGLLRKIKSPLLSFDFQLVVPT